MVKMDISKNAIISCVLVFILIFIPIPSLAAEYDFEFTDSYCGSTGEESRKIDIRSYFKEFDFYKHIGSIGISSIAIRGNGGRGCVIKYLYPSAERHSGIYLVPMNPGDDSVMDQMTITGVRAGLAFSIKAWEGELWFSSMIGLINYDGRYKTFIIRFSDELEVEQEQDQADSNSQGV